jgi:hypothetical protein
VKLRLILVTLVIICSLPAYAEYTYQLVIPPAAENANLFGINNAGKTVGGAFNDDFDFLYGFEYDMKTGVYRNLGEDFDVIEINNPGVMVGTDLSVLNGVCTIRDKAGNLTAFYPDSWTENSFCQARGVNPDGKISGFLIDEDNIFTGFIYDPEYGTSEEFLVSFQTIANGINAQGQNVGSVFLFPDQAYDGSPPGLYAYLREPDGSVKYFAIGNSLPGESRARGISENGLISGFYANPETWEYTGYVTTLPDGDGFEYVWLTDDEILHLKPCGTDLPPLPEGYVLVTDVFIPQVRNDGVAVGQCTDYYVDWFAEPFPDWIWLGTYGLIATPVK